MAALKRSGLSFHIRNHPMSCSAQDLGSQGASLNNMQIYLFDIVDWTTFLHVRHVQYRDIFFCARLLARWLNTAALYCVNVIQVSTCCSSISDVRDGCHLRRLYVLDFTYHHVVILTAVSTKVVPQKCKSVRDNADWYYG